MGYGVAMCIVYMGVHWPSHYPTWYSGIGRTYGIWCGYVYSIHGSTLAVPLSYMVQWDRTDRWDIWASGWLNWQDVVGFRAIHTNILASKTKVVS